MDKTGKPETNNTSIPNNRTGKNEQNGTNEKHDKKQEALNNTSWSNGKEQATRETREKRFNENQNSDNGKRGTIWTHKQN